MSVDTILNLENIYKTDSGCFMKHSLVMSADSVISQQAARHTLNLNVAFQGVSCVLCGLSCERDRATGKR